MTTRVNNGGEDGSFYYSAHTVILELADAAAFVWWVIQNGDPTALPQRYIHFYSVNNYVTGLSTWGQADGCFRCITKASACKE